MAIAQVIKYEGDNSTFVWKHPSEDFNSLTQLIVHESQEAIFFMNGQALDCADLAGDTGSRGPVYPECHDQHGRHDLLVRVRL